MSPTRSSAWWRRQKCHRPGHHHTRDGRYCYWSLDDPTEGFRIKGSPWHVRDRVTGRKVTCRNMREVRVWINAARLFRAEYHLKALKKLR